VVKGHVWVGGGVAIVAAAGIAWWASSPTVAPQDHPEARKATSSVQADASGDSLGEVATAPDVGPEASAAACETSGPFALGTCGDTGIVVAWVDQRALTSGPICMALREGVGEPARLAPEVLADQGKRLVEQAIDAALVAREAAALGVSVSDDEIAARLAGHEGLGDATRAEVRARLLEKKWVETVGELEPDAAEVRAEFDRAPERFGALPQVKAEAWLARPIGGAEGAAKDRAASWKAALERGERVPPEGVGAIEGAVFSPDGLEPALEQALWGAGQGADGGWLGPIGTRAGWLVVRVVERVPGARPRIEEVEPRVRVAATERRRVAETARLLAGLRAKSTIVRCIE
jgi:hypothetical protein